VNVGPLKVGDTLSLDSVYAEAGDNTGRVVREAGPLIRLPTTEVL
jgi:hypothetical protein